MENIKNSTTLRAFPLPLLIQWLFVALLLYGFGVFLFSHFISVTKSVSTVTYFILCTGLYFRKNKALHSLMMITGILVDLSVVLLLEFQRDAIHTAFHEDLNYLQMGHIVSSGLAALLFGPVLVLGLIRLCRPHSSPGLRTAHIRLGIITFFFRSLGFILMFTLNPKG